MRSESEPDSQPTFIEAARRAQIIAAAIDTIVALGYSGASLAAIARRAGVSKSALLYYFAGKEGLMRAVVEHIFAGVDAYMRPLVESESTPSEQLRTYISSNVAFIGSHRSEMTAIVEIIMGYRGRDGRPLFALSEADAGLVEIEAILVAGQETGEFRRFSPRVVAAAIRGSIDAIPPRLASPEVDVAAFGEQLVELFDRATRRDDHA